MKVKTSMAWRGAGWTAVASAAALSAAVWAGGQADPKVQASLKMTPSESRPREAATGTVTLTLPQGWHAYQNPPFKDYEIPVSLEGQKGTQLLKAKYPAGKSETFAGSETMVYEGQVKIPVEIRAQAKEGTQTVSLKVGYQLCNSGSCLPPESVTVTARLKVSKKAPAPPKPASPKPTPAGAVQK